MHNSQPARINIAAKAGQIIRIEQEQLNKHLGKVVRGAVERTLNQLLDVQTNRVFLSGKSIRAHRRSQEHVSGPFTRMQTGYKARSGKTQSSQVAHTDL